MPQFINFYENLAEARLRLLNTIVTYDGHPCYVHWIAEHQGDGRFRIYIEKLGTVGYGFGRDNYPDFPDRNNCYENNYASVLDEWLDRNPDAAIVRKLMSSAKFNKFRPFPLGNVNYNGEVYHIERRPTRQTIQGIRSESLLTEKVTASPNVDTGTGLGIHKPRVHIDIYGREFADCVLGNYPTYQEVIENLRSPLCANSGAAFHRDFSVVRGPIKTLFLCYKTEGVGIVHGQAWNLLVLGQEFDYLKEQIEELGVYASISVE